MVERLVFREVNVNRWDDLARLFEAPGGPKHCWCMVWRPVPAGEPRTDRRVKRATLEGLVRQGVPVGLLGYLDGEPVAWCSIAPRSTYRNLGGPGQASDQADNVWSLVCFFVLRRLRGQGIMRGLIKAAVQYAREKGATVVEAYPVDADSPSYRFMGFVPVFTQSGFQEVGRAGTRRHIMRLTL